MSYVLTFAWYLAALLVLAGCCAAVWAAANVVYVMFLLVAEVMA